MRAFASPRHLDGIIIIIGIIGIMDASSARFGWGFERARGTNGRRPWTLMEFARARRSEEMPLGDAARASGRRWRRWRRRRRTAAREAGRARGGTPATELYVPDIPVFLCAARMARDSAYVRSVLVHDERKPRMKPRLSWYDATDASWAPRVVRGRIKADLRYYFGDEDDPSKRWT